MHARTHARMHTHAHTCTQTHTHTHAHTIKPCSVAIGERHYILFQVLPFSVTTSMSIQKAVISSFINHHCHRLCRHQHWNRQSVIILTKETMTQTMTRTICPGVLLNGIRLTRIPWTVFPGTGPGNSIRYCGVVNIWIKVTVRNANWLVSYANMFSIIPRKCTVLLNKHDKLACYTVCLTYIIC